jgi:hypothetical protein
MEHGIQGSLFVLELWKSFRGGPSICGEIDETLVVELDMNAKAS